MYVLYTPERKRRESATFTHCIYTGEVGKEIRRRGKVWELQTNLDYF